jgi:hypothetical protein
VQLGEELEPNGKMFPLSTHHPSFAVCWWLLGSFWPHFKLEDDAPCAAQFPISIITFTTILWIERFRDNGLWELKEE